MSGCLKSS